MAGRKAPSYDGPLDQDDMIEELRAEITRLNEELERRTDEANRLAEQVINGATGRAPEDEEIPAVVPLVTAMVVLLCWWGLFRLCVIEQDFRTPLHWLMGLLSAVMTLCGLGMQGERIIIPKMVVTIVALVFAGQLALYHSPVLGLLVGLLVVALAASPLLEFCLDVVAEFLTSPFRKPKAPQDGSRPPGGHNP